MRCDVGLAVVVVDVTHVSFPVARIFFTPNVL